MFTKLKYCCLFFVAVTFTSCALFRPSPDKLYRRALWQCPYDVIIVPGVPFDGEEWSMPMKGRVIWASYLVKEGIAKNVIFSGGAVYTSYVEAKVMASYARELGVSKDKIFLETKAEHSTENVYNSYHLAKKMGFNKIAIASDPFQSALLMRFTKQNFKLPIAHIPFVVKILSQIDDVNPQIKADTARVENFKSIVESQSKWHRFRGTMGKNIHFEKE